MSQDWFRDVLAFSRKFNVHLEDVPRLPPASVVDLKLRHITEEAGELREAFAHGDLAGIADACADLIYVAISTAQATGIDLRPVWDAVHASNMVKRVGHDREDGKILKPSGWKPPPVRQILMRQPPLSQVASQTEPAGESNVASPEAAPLCWCGHRLDRDMETGAFLPCAFCIGLAVRETGPDGQEAARESDAAQKARKARETAERFTPFLTQPDGDDEDDDPETALELTEAEHGR
jgi:phosphoribosyl-ATP pyrophosphohydrolase